MDEAIYKEPSYSITLSLTTYLSFSTFAPPKYHLGPHETTKAHFRASKISSSAIKVQIKAPRLGPHATKITS